MLHLHYNQRYIVQSIYYAQMQSWWMMRVFLSYSEVDLNIARAVYRRLAEAGIIPWMSRFDIPVGVRWDRAIDAALHAADYLVLIHSRASYHSENCWDEWAFFLKRDKPVIPLIFDEHELPFRLERVQHVNFHTQSFDMAMIQLVDYLLPYDPAETQNASIPPNPFRMGDNMRLNYDEDETDSGAAVHFEEDDDAAEAMRILRERQARHMQNIDEQQPRAARSGTPRGQKR